jgi:hypothetical protein
MVRLIVAGSASYYVCRSLEVIDDRLGRERAR